MRKVVSIILLFIFVIAWGSGCATHAQTGAAVGGVTGAGAGAAIGAAAGGGRGALFGALIGGVVGTITGAAIGKHFDDQVERTRAQSVSYVDYTPGQGNVLRVTGTEATPPVVKPGDEVRIKVTYDVLASDPRSAVQVSETWVVMHKNEQVGDPIVRPNQYKPQGGHSSTLKFAVNKDFLPGEYQVHVTVTNGVLSQSVQSQFSIQEV